jgi:hypothetical protein
MVNEVYKPVTSKNKTPFLIYQNTQQYSVLNTTRVTKILHFSSHFIWDWHTGICNNSYFIIQGAVSGPVIKLTIKKKHFTLQLERTQFIWTEYLDSKNTEWAWNLSLITNIYYKKTTWNTNIFFYHYLSYLLLEFSYILKKKCLYST